MHSATSAPGPVVALVAVSDAARDPGPLVEALGTHHPGIAVHAVWSGDPQLRPRIGVPWLEAAEIAGPEWERYLLAADRQRSMWRAVAATVPALLDGGAAAVLVLEAGAVAVVGDLGTWLEPPAVARFVPLVDAPLPDDGRGPTDVDLVRAGFVSGAVALLGRSSGDLLEWIATRPAVDDGLGSGPWLAAAAQLFGADTSGDPRVGAGPWRWPANDDVALVEAPHFDPDRPWVLDPQLALPARVDLVDHPGRRAVVDRATAQLAGPARPLVLPAGVVVDDDIRALVAANPSCPPPWSSPVEFRTWLEARYWFALHARRRDLLAAFPEPIVHDRESFDQWCASAFTVDSVPFLVRHRPAGASRLLVDEPPGAGGVNLVGYLGRESSLGDVARRLHECLRAGEVPTSTIAYERTASGVLADVAASDQRLRFDTSLAVVTADQFPALRSDHPELFRSSRVIGYWFWELATVPRPMLAALDLVDEIWAGSRFVVDAFTAVADVPVRLVPIPVAEPQPSCRRRADFAELAPAGQRFVFLVAFDHLSVTERKNPIGAIRAFQRAFAPGEGPVLVVKSMNAGMRWVHHQKVVAAAEGRPDIVFWDERLSRADQMALVAASDCLVSLHRSEGLGLHLAEAMWLGVPTIATRYSGNLDFQDDECAMLVDAAPVKVTDGQGIYPPTATWADPDLDQAAAAMRTLAGDPRRCAAIAVDALARMKMQPGPAETGKMIGRLLGLGGS